MCSISGFFDNVTTESAQERLSARERLDVVERMNRALKHRGPDDEGVVAIDIKSDHGASLCLGNTRLAVIDISAAGHQPMHDPDTGNWITYNGETYNFRELRREIGNEFGPWRSNTDTEVVLRAYRKWGRDAFARLRGMFAVAIWDRQEEALVLARDRFGIKPLYYSFQGSVRNATPVPNGQSSFTAEHLVFASEVRALLASGFVPRKLSSAALGSYLEFGSVQSPLSILENVWSLMPGKCLKVKQGENSTFVTSLSSFSDAAAGTSTYREVTSREQAKVELRGVLEDSVRKHLVSDVPMGVFLSGGMDSSAMVALMSRVEAERPKTFSVVFNEEKFNESEHSRLVANKFQTDHHEIHLSEESLLAQLPDAIAALDQPTMDGINTYVVSKAVKEAGVTVALSGLGGDELFGGYPSFARALRMRRSSAFARGALRAVSKVGAITASGSVQRNKFWQLAGSKGSPEDVYRITRQLFPPEVVQDLLVDHSFKISLPDGSSGPNVPDTVNAVSKLEFEGYMVNTLLRDTDSMSMAHSLEVRVPFVDVGVADFVQRLPGKWKLNGSTSPVPKPLLADVLADLLPRDFLTRRKMGFTLPFEKWMTTNLRAEISEVFGDKSLCVAAGIKQDSAERVWQRFLSQPKAVTWSRPWSLYVLAKWCQVNRVTP